MDGVLTTEHHDEVYLRTVRERGIRNKASVAVLDGYKGFLQTDAVLLQRADKEDQLLSERHGRLPNLGVPKRDNSENVISEILWEYGYEAHAAFGCEEPPL